MQECSLEPVFTVAKMRRNALILEDRSAAYRVVCEQRTAEDQRISASIVYCEDRFLAWEHGNLWTKVHSLL